MTMALVLAVTFSFVLLLLLISGGVVATRMEREITYLKTEIRHQDQLWHIRLFNARAALKAVLDAAEAGQALSPSMLAGARAQLGSLYDAPAQGDLTASDTRPATNPREHPEPLYAAPQVIQSGGRGVAVYEARKNGVSSEEKPNG